VRTLCFWIIVGSFVILPAFAANIVTNPSFETGLSGWAAHPCTDPSCNLDGFPPNGWAAQAIDPHTGANAANTGCIGALCLDPVQGDWIAQTLITVPSTTYTLTFWMYPGGSGNSPAVEIDVYWNGALVGAFPAVPDIYQQFTLPGLLAASTSSVLQFNGRSDPFLVFLDDVDVEPVPEPLSFVFSGLGLGLLGLLRAKRVG
jgi:hypothetical protein